jgi:hypothetical protein
MPAILGRSRSFWQRIYVQEYNSAHVHPAAHALDPFFGNYMGRNSPARQPYGKVEAFELPTTRKEPSNVTVACDRGGKMKLLLYAALSLANTRHLCWSGRFAIGTVTARNSE